MLSVKKEVRREEVKTISTIKLKYFFIILGATEEPGY